MKLCRAICDALCAADPAHGADFRANLVGYLQELSELDADFRQVVGEKKRDLLVFGDRFPLLYFCREYGLELPGGLSRLLVRHGAVPLHVEISH